MKMVCKPIKEGYISIRTFGKKFKGSPSYPKLFKIIQEGYFKDYFTLLETEKYGRSVSKEGVEKLLKDYNNYDEFAEEMKIKHGTGGQETKPAVVAKNPMQALTLAFKNLKDTPYIDEMGNLKLKYTNPEGTAESTITIDLFGPAIKEIKDIGNSYSELADELKSKLKKK